MFKCATQKKLLITLALVFVFMFALTTVAYAGTISVYTYPRQDATWNNWDVWSNPARLGATIYIYSGDGTAYYYNSYYSPQNVWGGSEAINFYGCPNGVYRVRVVWDNGVQQDLYGVSVFDSDYYAYPACVFYSPNYANPAGPVWWNPIKF